MLRELSESASVSLRIAAPSHDDVPMDEGFSIAPDMMFAEVNLADVRALVVADSASGARSAASIERVIDDLSLLSLLDRAATTGVTVGSIGDGTLLLGRAGVVRGVAITHAFGERDPRAEDSTVELARSAFRATTFVDEDVVIDAPSAEQSGATIVTAKAWAAVEFAKKLMGVVMSASDDADRRALAQTARIARRLRGVNAERHGDPYERWVITLAQVAERTTSREDIEAHVAHLRALERRGVLELAGPLPEARSGMVIVRAASREDAERIAREDPFVKRGVRTFEVRRWLLSCDDNGHML